MYTYCNYYIIILFALECVLTCYYFICLFQLGGLGINWTVSGPTWAGKTLGAKLRKTISGLAKKRLRGGVWFGQGMREAQQQSKGARENEVERVCLRLGLCSESSRVRPSSRRVRGQELTSASQHARTRTVCLEPSAWNSLSPTAGRTHGFIHWIVPSPSPEACT